MTVHANAKDSTKLFARNLRFAAKMRGVTQIEIAEAVNAVKQSVNGWFQAYRMPNPEYMDRLADFLGISVSALFDENGRCGMDKPTDIRVPHVGDDGTISLMSSFSIPLAIPSSLANNITSTSCFSYEVKDNSMSPVFQNGDILFCQSTDSAPSGKYVIVLLDGKAVLRQFNVSQDGSLFLYAPVNPSDTARTAVCQADAEDKPRIIGIPFSLQRKV